MRAGLRRRAGHQALLRPLQDRARRLPQVHQRHPRRAPTSDWYASVMLNRLMFIYFIQKKGFLDGDRDYLRNRLGRCAGARQGQVRLASTATSCCRCSIEGLRQARTRTPELDALLGQRALPERRPLRAAPDRGSATARHPDPRRGLRAHLRLLRRIPLAPRRAPAARRQRDQPRRARLHLREVHQPEADGGLLHQGGHHRLHQQEHGHPVPVRRRPRQVQGRLRESRRPVRLGPAHATTPTATSTPPSATAWT